MRDTLITRRTMLQSMGLAAGAATLGLTGLTQPVRAQEVAEDVVDFLDAGGGSHPWPTLGIRPDPVMDDQLLIWMS